MIYNVLKLTGELDAAGIEFCGCSSDGKVWDAADITKDISARPDVAAVLAAHNPEPGYEAKRRAEYARVGAGDHEMTVALWEMMVENRPEAAQDLQIKRLEVKAKYPKSL